MFNNRSKSMIGGLLTKASRCLIASNVVALRESYTKWSGKRYRCEDIIAGKVSCLMGQLRGEIRYQPFIMKF